MVLALINRNYPVFRPKYGEERIRFVQDPREEQFIVPVGYHSLSPPQIEWCSDAFSCSGTKCPFCKLVDSVPEDKKHDPEVARVLKKFRVRSTYIGWVYSYSSPNEFSIWVIEKDLRSAILALRDDHPRKFARITDLRAGYDLEVLMNEDGYIADICLAEESSAISKSEDHIQDLEQGFDNLPILQGTVHTYYGKTEARWLQEMRWDIDSALELTDPKYEAALSNLWRRVV